MRSTVMAIVVGMLSGSSILTGCSRGQVISAGEVAILVSERPDGGMSALAGGRIEVVGGCLGANGVVIVWPHGTDLIDQNPLTIDVPDYGTFTLGDEIQIAGGFVVEHTSRTIEPGPLEFGDITIPADCAEYDIFLAH